jgi:hypothetical protein
MSSEVIRTAGRFELLRQVGHGGMAVVYLARQTDLDRFVALKELRLMTAPDPTLSQRFLREAQMAGGMSHPNIVTVHEHFEHAGTPYIAMEYLERGSLRPYIGRMTPAQIAGVLEGMLAGLDHAAGENIVHRDLKPENVMVTREGRIKIGDFGIARARNRLQTGSFMTAAGTTVGTPTYMAPEQAMAKDIGAYTDLYSVGIMAYEMLVGSVPFHDTDTPVAILLRHINEEIQPAASVNPDVDPELSAWIDRLLVKDWRGRTPSAAQAWDELEDIIITLLGSRWRRDARLPEMLPQGGADRPLTPAQFTATGDTALPPAGTTGETSGFQSFAWVPAAGAAAAPEADDGASSRESEPVAAGDPGVTAAPVPLPEAAAAPALAPDVTPAPEAQPIAAPEPGDEPATGFHTFGAAPSATPPAEASPPPVPEPVAAPPPEPAPEPAEAAPPPVVPPGEPEPAPVAVGPPPVVVPAALEPAPDPELTVTPDAVPAPVASSSGPPTATPRAAPSGRTGSPRRWLLGAGAVALVLVIVVVALVAGGGGGGGDEPAEGPTQADAAPVADIGAGSVDLKVPAGWSAADAGAAGLDDLGLTGAVAGAPDGQTGQGVVAGTVPNAQLAPGLLPASLADAQDVQRSTVRLSPGIEAYKMTGLRTGAGQLLTLYAVPTTAGAAMLACHAPDARAVALGRACDAIARTLRPGAGARALAVGPSKSVAEGLTTAGTRLSRDATPAARTLRTARTPEVQARTARALAAGYRRAASSVGALPPGPGELGAMSGLQDALGAAGTAYGRLATAAGRHDRGAYAAAASAVRAASGRLAAAAAAVTAAGYTVDLAALDAVPALRKARKKAAVKTSSTPTTSSTSSTSSTQSSTPTQQQPNPQPTPTPRKTTPKPAPKGDDGVIGGGSG